MFRPWILCAALLVAANAAHAASSGGTTSPATTKNDDSCDIAVTPAATLLVPYFEVDVQSPASTARTTLLSIMNVSRYPQIARVTLWSDWSFPAYSFDLFLTGYGVQSVNLRDIFTTGALPLTSVDAPPGPLSRASNANPNHLFTMAGDCALRPSAIPAPLVAALRVLLTTGRTTLAGCTPTQVGGVHQNVIGYATIDVVATCGSLTPADPAYYATELLFDNVLVGDYEDVMPDTDHGNFAGGTPMVHIRAIPEGGPAGSIAPTDLPYTFYDRLTMIGENFPRTIDRRQPLPATFATHIIGGLNSSFQGRIQLWREAYTGANPACARYADNSGKNLVEIVRFDEHENAFVLGTGLIICTPPPPPPGPPSTSSIALANPFVVPYNTLTSDVGGWLYINASNSGSPAYSVNGARDFKTGSSTFANCSRGNQSWVSVAMTAEGRFSVLMDAAQLANGCSISPGLGATIQPGANVTP
jgi:hypothetical protein